MDNALFRQPIPDIKKRTTPALCLVVPVYNEEAVLPIAKNILNEIYDDLVLKGKILNSSCILFVDDGSIDSSWDFLQVMCSQNSSRFKALKLSKNFGHQNALLSGLYFAKDMSDCVISMDADLQDDVNLIERFVDCYLEGYDVVYGIRDSRETDTYFKRKSAIFYYQLLRKLGINIKHNHADFRLMSRRALDELSQFKETNLFLRGIIPLIGLPSKDVYYARQKRIAGKTKYPLKKMLLFAIEGITSFTNVPLRMISFLGFGIFILSIIMSIYVLCQDLVFHDVVKGWSSLSLSMYALSGVQLLCLGIIGEYVGKIYSETKKRPRYIVEDKLI